MVEIFARCDKVFLNRCSDAAEKLEKISAWNLTKVRSKKEVIDEARTKGETVHFASQMDICLLINAELEAKRSSCTPR